MSAGAVLKNSLRVEEGHFRHDLSHSDSIKLFREHVELIEVETTSYCNRTCSFCPNSFIDRLSEKFTMPETTWRSIIQGLIEVDYRGTFVWSRYSEPLSEKRIVSRVREVREAAPHSRICINSNGDYLNSEYLNELENAGLNRLWIDIYFPDDEVYDLESAMNYHEKFLKRINRKAVLISTSPELAHSIASDRMQIVSHVRNIVAMKAMDLSDRGGLVKSARRTARQAPCYAPYKHLVIDWDGSVVICCQLRSDSPAHRAGVVGRIGSDLGLVEAYLKLAGWRRALRNYGPKKGPCATCNVSEYQSTTLTRWVSLTATDTKSPVRNILKRGLRPILRKTLRY